MNIGEAHSVNQLLEYLKAPTPGASEMAGAAAANLARKAHAALRAGMSPDEVNDWWPALSVRLSPRRVRMVQTDLRITYRHAGADEKRFYSLHDWGLHGGDLVSVSADADGVGLWVYAQAGDHVQVRLVMPMDITTLPTAPCSP